MHPEESKETTSVDNSTHIFRQFEKVGLSSSSSSSSSSGDMTDEG
jgi:hypothetical protein